MTAHAGILRRQLEPLVGGLDPSTAFAPPRALSEETKATDSFRRVADTRAKLAVQLRRRQPLSLGTVVLQGHTCDITYTPEPCNAADLHKLNSWQWDKEAPILAKGKNITVKGFQAIKNTWLVTSFYSGIVGIGQCLTLSASFTPDREFGGSATATASRDASGCQEVDAQVQHHPLPGRLKAMKVQHRTTLKNLKWNDMARGCLPSVQAGSSIAWPGGFRIGLDVEPPPPPLLGAGGAAAAPEPPSSIRMYCKSPNTKEQPLILDGSGRIRRGPELKADVTLMAKQRLRSRGLELSQQVWAGAQQPCRATIELQPMPGSSQRLSARAKVSSNGRRCTHAELKGIVQEKSSRKRTTCGAGYDSAKGIFTALEWRKGKRSDERLEKGSFVMVSAELCTRVCDFPIIHRMSLSSKMFLLV